ncbi:GT-D fold domain-containing glycosyltransferase [Chryseobacterium sp. SN22]|uniref:GT-D fold domain-containing glycosyltransferase n=1 Tax=Chryseobacterium sp. SN22 TaxID=2606431 RepID=UPI0016295600|nr:GT-D fold domain-containing glycosyltransferase [Chryseobacterium sp. SN22]
MSLKKKISSRLYYYQWLINTRKLREDFPYCHIMDIKGTIDDIIKNKRSISRFGDGEFRLMFPEYQLEFQENSERIREKMREVIGSDLDNHLVCLPEPFISVRSFDIATKYWWKKFINNYGPRISPFLNKNRRYGNSFITRFYLGYEDKSEKRNLKIIHHLKKIWDQKDILIIEGKYSRLGVGNDLFANAASIQRIICPEKNAFSCYDHIFEAAIRFGKDKVILAALGPSATILAYDLAKLNYWAVDIGHIDIEYIWFLRKATEKISIEGRHVNEAEIQKSFELPIEFAEVYQQSIILNITV